jgi:hypothetical protein
MSKPNQTGREKERDPQNLFEKKKEYLPMSEEINHG